MNPIDHVLASASRRLFVSRWLRLVVVLTTGAIGAAIVVLLLGRLGVSPLPTASGWGVFSMVAGGVVLVASLLAAALTSPKREVVARRLDDAAGLKEAISTALHVRAGGSADEAWGANVLESATRSARGVRLSAALPVRAPDGWYAPGVAALVMLIAWVTIPTMDLFGRRAAAEEQVTKKEEVAVVAQQVENATKKAESKLEEAMKKLGEKEEALGEQKAELPKPTTPEEIRRAAMKQLGKMQDKVAQLKLGERAQTAAAMTDKMKQLRSTPGPLEEFSKQMAKGNVQAAEAALETMAQQMASGQMDSPAMQQAQKQLENMAKQMKQLAEDKKKLEDQLAKAGLDPKLASSPEALKQAMAEKSELSEQQKQELQNAAKAQENASSAMQAMAQACENMANAMQKSQAGQKAGQNPGEQGQPDGQSAQQQAQAMQQMAEAMSQMETAQSDMQSLEAAMSEAQAQMKSMSEGMGQCENPGMGEGQGSGQGEMGQAGMGEGGQGEPEQGDGMGRGQAGISQGGGGVGEVEDVERWQKRKSRSPLGQGPMIGTMLVQGEQVKGESRARMIEMTEAAAQQATEALEANQVPRELQDPIKRYFGRLAAKVKGQEKAADAATPAPAPKPAEPAKPAEPTKPAGAAKPATAKP